MITSGKNVTVVEITGHIVVTNVPLKILLKDTISNSIAEPFDECIKTRFSGVSLPTTIKDLKEVITNHGNFVTVKTNNRLTRFLVKMNSGVAIFPINVVRNGIAHLLFDLTHFGKIREGL